MPFWWRQKADMLSFVKENVLFLVNIIKKDNDQSVLENFHTSSLFQILLNVFKFT